MAYCLAGLGKLKSPERKQGSEEEKGRRSKTEEESNGIMTEAEKWRGKKSRREGDQMNIRRDVQKNYKRDEAKKRRGREETKSERMRKSRGLSSSNDRRKVETRPDRPATPPVPQ